MRRDFLPASAVLSGLISAIPRRICRQIDGPLTWPIIGWRYLRPRSLTTCCEFDFSVEGDRMEPRDVVGLAANRPGGRGLAQRRRLASGRARLHWCCTVTAASGKMASPRQGGHTLSLGEQTVRQIFAENGDGDAFFSHVADDVVIASSLTFLERDMASRPEALVPVTGELLRRGEALVEGVEIDLDAPLTDG